MAWATGRDFKFFFSFLFPLSRLFFFFFFYARDLEISSFFMHVDMIFSSF